MIQKHLTGLEIHYRSIKKLLPLFVTKEQRVKQSNKKKKKKKKKKSHKKKKTPNGGGRPRGNRVIISTDINFLKSKTIEK
jgi:hypothetical protein